MHHDTGTWRLPPRRTTKKALLTDTAPVDDDAYLAGMDTNNDDHIRQVVQEVFKTEIQKFNAVQDAARYEERAKVLLLQELDEGLDDRGRRG